MNIIFITHYQELYGANKSLCNLLQGLDMQKHKVLVLCPSRGDMTDYLNEKRIPNMGGLFFRGWEYNNGADLVKFPYRFSRSLFTLLAIYSKLKRFKPDVIYSNSSVIWFGKAISILMRRPHVWHVREFGMKDYGLRMVGGKKLSRYLMNNSAAVIAISKAIEKEVLQDVRPDIRHQIYNGIVLHKDVINKDAVCAGKRSFTFCMAGLLMESKGFEDALRAMKIVIEKFPQARLLIAGKGKINDAYESYLHELALRLGIANHVSFLGFIKDVREVYENSDCLLMCSRAEGLGRVTIEAMASGLPVIGHNSGATPEIVVHTVNGYLYNQGSEELATYMMELMMNEHYHLLSENAAATVKRNFTIENYVEEIENILQKILVK